MACPLCGEVCRCTLESHPMNAGPRRTVRFEPDNCTREQQDGCERVILIEPEAPDDSDEQFAANLSAPHSTSRVRFVVDGDDDLRLAGSECREEGNRMAACKDENLSTQTIFSQTADGSEGRALVSLQTDAALSVTGAERQLEASTQSSALPTAREPFHSESISSDSTYWKDEVAARLNYYRARRKPRPPKYPSLRLKFEAPEKRSGRPEGDEYSAASRESLAVEATLAGTSCEQTELPSSPSTACSVPNPIPESARIIEFPRSHYDFVYPQAQIRNELADPVFETPRIVEVPEVETDAPALGGIILEPEGREPERRPGFEIPLQSAPMRRRLLATVCDGVMVLGACILFGYIAFKISGAMPLFKETATLSIGLFFLFWTTYQYLLLTYCGTTPGLRFLQLQLRQFDGSPVHRRTRRWRVLASLLSGVSLGLGYAWCLLDEDALCWHDRITGTHLQVAESGLQF